MAKIRNLFLNYFGNLKSIIIWGKVMSNILALYTHRKENPLLQQGSIILFSRGQDVFMLLAIKVI
ncbi:MAG: hypothetical protein ABI691_21845 [Ginsengibacter sp.]